MSAISELSLPAQFLRIPQRLRPLLPVALIGVLCFLQFFTKLGDRDLWSSHEARAAQNAQSVLNRETQAVPKLFDLSRELQKPPMYYWLVAAFASLNGGVVDAWAVRLPAAFGATICVFAVYVYFLRRNRPSAAVLAAIILATMTHFVWLGRTGRIDMPLAAAITVAIIVFQECRWAAALPLSTAILLKGPIAVALFATTLRWKTVRAGLLAMMLGAVLAAPWFVWAHIETDGEFTKSFFWHHNFQRAAGGAEGLASHPWWLYLVRIGIDLLPWSLLVIPAAFLFRSSDKEAWFGATWFLGITALLSLSRFKRADYLLPAYPGAAIFLAAWMEPHFTRWQPTGVIWRRGRTIGLAFVVASTIAIWQWHLTTQLPLENERKERHSFAATIRSFAPSPQPIYFFRVEDHLLAFHLGRPLNTFLEWENLEIWADRPGPNWFVMTGDDAEEWSRRDRPERLTQVAKFSCLRDDGRPHLLVLMQSRAVECTTTTNPSNKP